MRKLEIHELQELLFDALCYIDEICQEHNIRYYLAYGTLLGAVREHDFIPWDPDIDLFMSRENYQKFCKVMEEAPQEKYFLDRVEKNPYTTAPLEGRICIKGTSMFPDLDCRVPLRTEIRIDIAPLDFASRDKKYVTRRNKKITIYEKLFLFKYTHMINKKRLISYGFHAVLKAMPYKMTLRRLLKTAGDNHDIDTDRYICLTAAYTCNKKKPFRNVYPVKWFGEPEFVMFHGKQFPCPCKYHEFLRYFYGDNYMTPIRREEDNEYYLLDEQ